MRFVLSVLIGLAMLVPATPARAATVSGTIVDVARYLTGSSSSMMMNADMMMHTIGSAHGGMMQGFVASAVQLR